MTAMTKTMGGPYDRLFRPGYVHRDLYVDPVLFDLEMRDLFGRTWVYVGHETEIPEPNDFVTRTLGRRPIILCRTNAGGIAVLLNRCPHRGAVICRSERGNAKGFTCGYHAWSFANDGRCAGIPLRHAYGDDFRTRDHDLAQPAKVDSYRGFIFAAMTPEVPPLLDHLAGARGYIDQWLDRDEGRPVLVNNGVMRFRTHANWKTVYDNAGDGYHPPFSHESMLRVFAARYGDVDMKYFTADVDDSPMEALDLGNGHTMLDQRPAMHAVSAWERQHVMPGREVLEQGIYQRFGPDQGRRMLDASTGSGMNLNIFPNLLIIGNQIQRVEPVSVDETVIDWFSTSLAGAPDEINAVRMRMQEDFPSFGEVDDSANFEACQAGLTLIPELEWVDIRRHMATGRGGPRADGLWRDPVTSDRHMRSYFAAWKAVMETGAAARPAEGYRP